MEQGQTLEQSEKKRHLGTYLIAVLLFLAGFVAVAGTIHLLIRNKLYLHADIRSEKLQLLDQWQGKAYSAAFGSSHVHNGFDPRTFDVALAGTPLQTRSLNLAIAGGSQAEQRVVALDFLQTLHAPPHIGANIESRACFVVLELGAGANFTNDHLVHPRAINIYDADTVRFIEHLTSPNMGIRQRIGRVAYAGLAMILHYVNVGMLSNEIFAPVIDEAAFRMETVDDRRGLLSIPAPPPVRKKLEEIIAESQGVPQPHPLPLLPGNAELLDQLSAATPVKPLSMVYLMMPMLADLKSYPVTPDDIRWSGGTAPIVNMARPDLYPQLYQAKYWTDEAHLNEEGARLLTKLMAQQLKQWYAVHGEPQRCGG